MPVSAVTIGGVMNALLASETAERTAIITSRSTGGPALAEINMRLFRNTMVLQCHDIGALDDLVEQHRGTLDLVMVDPYHYYDLSTYCLERCLELLRPGGTLVCHDCVPPPITISPEPVVREWCGVTFAAFHDVMTSRAVAWCTVAADYGIGLAVAPAASSAGATDGAIPAASATDSATTSPCWTEATHDQYVARYAADPFGVMHTVRADEWHTALDRLAAGASLSDLAATFAGWDDLVPLDQRPNLPRFNEQPSLLRRSARAARRRVGRLLR